MIWIRQKVRVVDGYQRRQSVKGGGKGKKKKREGKREKNFSHTKRKRCLLSQLVFHQPTVLRRHGWQQLTEKKKFNFLII